MTGLLGSWHRENPGALKDSKLLAAQRTSMLALQQPEVEEAFLEHQEHEEHERPPPVDTSRLPATFHVAAATTEIMKSEVFEGCSVERFWRVVYSDASAPLRTRYLEKEMNCWNVTVGRWAPHATLGIARLVTYEVDTHAPVGPQQTRVLEYEACDRDEALTKFTHRTVVMILDATFGENTASPLF